MEEIYVPVGAIVFSVQHQEHYTMLARNDDGSMTVRWLGDGPPSRPGYPRIEVHGVLDPGDRVVGVRERLVMVSREHRRALALRLGTA